MTTHLLMSDSGQIVFMQRPCKESESFLPAFIIII